MVSGVLPSNESSILTMASATTTQPISSTENPLVVFNITAQINEKLTPSSFPQWRAQFEALLIGYDLMDYVNGDSICPASDETSSSQPKRNHCIRQDKLIISAILASTSTTITPLIATTKTSQEAWKKLKNMYASKSRTRAMQLKKELTLIQRGNRTVPDYLHAVKALTDEIALIDHPISNDDLTLYILNELGPDFRDIAAPIRAREKSLAFEELHYLLVGHENYLSNMEAAAKQLVVAANFTSKNPSFHGSNSGKGAQRLNAPFRSQGSSRTGNDQQRDQRRQNNVSSRNNSAHKRYQPKCQLCDQLDHTAKTCPQLQPTEMSINSLYIKFGENKWLIDSAPLIISPEIYQITIHSEYDGTNEVVLGDGTGLTVSHIGSLALYSPK
ncbi:hypothetical protein Pint_10633 [Pistacia integerrima]|uniref:Uncharacterized protein n=1 Tax=Pistacia integerrima TaxID=434235 RepID=A0ACC0XLL1_9ROSI|nr:hypothetical protein Pint_10633 [Pistacia integerrima]